MVIKIQLKFSSLSTATKYFERMLSPYRCGEMAYLAMREPYYTFLKDTEALDDFNKKNKGKIIGTLCRKELTT